MGKDSAVLEIYKDASDGAYYYKTTINGTVSAPSKVGKSRIMLQFDRSSGAQKPDANGKCCSRIWIQKNSTEKVITIYKETGKVVCE